nr:uncharacterized protein LOC127337159 isoform X2 [Lolium perenne]
MSQHSWNGQQQHIPRSAAFSFACQWLGAHQVLDERLAPGYNHQMFDRTSRVFDTVSNHTYAPQDHPRVLLILQPCYHSSPYFPTILSTTPTPKLLYTNSLYPHSASTNALTTTPSSEAHAHKEATVSEHMPPVWSSTSSDDWMSIKLNHSVRLIHCKASSPNCGTAGAGGCSDGQGSSSKDGGNVEKEAASDDEWLVVDRLLAPCRDGQCRVLQPRVPYMCILLAGYGKP